MSRDQLWVGKDGFEFPEPSSGLTNISQLRALLPRGFWWAKHMKLVSSITEKAGLKQAVGILGRLRIGVRVVIKESSFDSHGGKNKMMEL